MLYRSRTQRLLVFFFQAEDGIRDVAVTGVQTCALPISFRGAASVIARQLYVDHGAVEFCQPRNAPCTKAAFVNPAESQFLSKPHCELMPRRDYHFVLNARVVRQDNVSVRSITKQANDGRMSPV